MQDDPAPRTARGSRETTSCSKAVGGILKSGMANDDRGANYAETPRGGFLSRYVFSTDHKTIGLNYLWLALFSVFLGMAMSLLMMTANFLNYISP